jgi:hypothetical protein
MTGCGQSAPVGDRWRQSIPAEFEDRHLVRHDFHGDWNYTITAADNPDVTRPK